MIPDRSANKSIRLLFLLLCLCFGASAQCDPLRVAVAANFKPVLERLVSAWNPGNDVTISAGSTGALYAQIINGAPFDVFFAADSDRPRRLDEAGLARSRQTYGYGRLAFWQPGADESNEASLTTWTNTLAIANPRHAPYGRAAMEVMEKLDHPNLRTIRGSNIAQAHTFVATGNVPAGLVALSQLKTINAAVETYWIVPDSYHKPIEQQLVIVSGADERADHLVAFLDTIDARQIMNSAGYGLP